MGEPDNYANSQEKPEVEWRLQIAGLDGRYQSAIDEVADRLTTVEADLALDQSETKDALTWLGANADALAYFFGGAASLVDQNGQCQSIEHRGMYAPPEASGAALADRGLLYNRLLAVIADGALKKAAGDSPELQQALDRVVGVVRVAYLDHLGRQFATTRNPAYAWHAVKLVLGQQLDQPQWLSDYLGKCANAIYEAGQSRTPGSHAFIAATFGFIDPANGNKFIGQLCDVHDDGVRLSAYKLMQPQLIAGVKLEAVKQDVRDRTGIPGTTAIKYKGEIDKRVQTDHPHDQDI